MTESNDWGSTPTPDARAAPPAPTAGPQPRRAGGLRGRTAAMATVAGLAGGGLIGGYVITQAATSPSPSPSPATSRNGSTTAPQPGDNDAPHGSAPDMPRLGGSGDEAEDQQTVATAIGISVSQLQTELAKDGTIAAVAKAHNVDPAKVIQALVDAKNKEIDAAVAGGKLTQAQGAAEKARAQQEATNQVNNPAEHGGPGGRGGHRGGPGGGAQQEDLAIVAGVLGISTSQLETDIANGQTIAAVAKAQNVDVAKVISALVDSENKEIDARVASGQLTQAQAAQDKANVTQRVTDLVNNTETDGH